MESLIGMQFNDFVIVAADQTNARSIMVMKDDEVKIHQILNHLLLAVSGESGDTVQFAEYISKNIQLYRMRNGYNLTPKAAATFTRKNLADYLRSRSPYMVNLLMAGYDKTAGPQLFFMDYLASCIQIPYAIHGYGGIFSVSIMDRYYRPDATEEEAYEIVKKCIREIHKRLFVSLPNFQVMLVGKDGVKNLPTINAKTLDS